jgi:flagellar basal-body rod protein FlgG
MPTSLTQILNVTRSGMLARLIDLDLVSNNLANVNTNGYKSSRSNFQELLNAERYSGVQIRSTQRFMDQGQIKKTANPLDLAINGNGFFAVTLPDGRTAYTRDGQFTLDAQRRIVSANGYPLVWQGQIPQDASDINVLPDGTVMALQGSAWNEIGRIQLSRFPNPTALEGYGQSLWLETPPSGAAQAGAPGAEGYGQILSGALEGSNVSLANEMSQLVTLQRSFEMSLRTFQQTDQMLSQAIHMRR